MEQLQVLIKKNQGQTLVEILLVIAITAIMLPALLTGLLTSKDGKAQQTQRARAIALMHEGTEVVRNLKNQNWSYVATNGTYHPARSINNWSLGTGSENINGLTRSITISDVNRNATGEIDLIGGTLDPSTKRVVVGVSWGTPIPTTINTTLYLTRYANNASGTQTTEDDFDDGINNGTVITNDSNGEVTLAAGGGGGDWCNPSLSVTTVDLSRQGIPTAISAMESGSSTTVVTGTGGNASGPTFVKTTFLGNPPDDTFAGEFDNSKANGVFVMGNYGFLATDSNSEEVKILDLTSFSNPPTNSKFTQLGAFNAPGNTDGDSVFAVGDYGYMTAVDKFYIFRLSDFTQVSTTDISLSGTGEKVVVVGNYAYVITNATTNQFQIIDVTSKTNPTLLTPSLTLGSTAGVDIDINDSGTRAYAVTAHHATQQELYIINIENPTSPTKISGTLYNTNSMAPKGVSLGTGNKLIIVGSGGTYQYQVVNIGNETNPTNCGNFVISGGASAVSSILQSDGYAYSYVVTGDASQELKIILGGAGGQFVFTGEFTSSPIDPGNSASYNYFSPVFNEPPQTSITFKVSVADPVNGNCDDPTYTFVGPLGTTDPGDVYTGAGAIPLLTNGNYKNPGRCMKYRAYFSTNDTSASPTLESVVINYSP